MSCRPDWIRLVGPECQARAVLRLLLSRFGAATGHNAGAKYFQEGSQWHPGVLFSAGHESNIIMIDLQGSRLAMMSVPDMMELTSAIMMHGFHCTRIDLAVDHVGMGLCLYQHALKSCEEKQLCKLRSYSSDSEYKVDGTPIRLLLKLGKRDSFICARIYDKGLETKTLPPGQWERLEVEFKDDRSPEVCMVLVKAGEQLPEILWRYVIGAFDFRIKNGRTELGRRPRVKWWDDYIGQTTPLDSPPCQKDSGFDTWWNWARTSFASRFLQVTEIMGVSPETLLIDLLRDLKPSSSESHAISDLRARLKPDF